VAIQSVPATYLLANVRGHMTEDNGILATVNKRLDELDDRLDETRRDVDGIAAKLASHEQSLRTCKQRIDNHYLLEHGRWIPPVSAEDERIATELGYATGFLAERNAAFERAEKAETERDSWRNACERRETEKLAMHNLLDAAVEERDAAGAEAAKLSELVRQLQSENRELREAGEAEHGDQEACIADQQRQIADARQRLDAVRALCEEWPMGDAKIELCAALEGKLTCPEGSADGSCAQSAGKPRG